MSTVTITIHSAQNLPDKVGLLKSCNPSVKLYLGTAVWESRRLDKPGSFAQWEETAPFVWDGQSSLAIDLMSGSECFAKAFINLNEYIGRSNSWAGSVQLDAHGTSRTRPVLNCSFVRGGAGAQPGFGVNVVAQPGMVGGMGGAQVRPQPGFGGNQVNVVPQPGFGGNQVNVVPQPGFGGNQVNVAPGFQQPGFRNPMAR